MERKNSSAKRLNVIDVLIIIGVVLCVVGIVIRFGGFSFVSPSKDLDQFELRFSVKNLSYTSEDAFVKGDTVTAVDSGVVLGKLMDVDWMPAEFYALDKSGNPIVVSYPESTKIDVTGTILSEGVMGENGYLLGGVSYVAPGAEYAVQTEHMDFVLKIIDIAEK